METTSGISGVPSALSEVNGKAKQKKYTKQQYCHGYTMEKRPLPCEIASLDQAVDPGFASIRTLEIPGSIAQT